MLWHQKLLGHVSPQEKVSLGKTRYSNSNSLSYFNYDAQLLPLSPPVHSSYCLFKRNKKSRWRCYTWSFTQKILRKMQLNKHKDRKTDTWFVLWQVDGSLCGSCWSRMEPRSTAETEKWVGWCRRHTNTLLFSCAHYVMNYCRQQWQSIILSKQNKGNIIDAGVFLHTSHTAALKVQMWFRKRTFQQCWGVKFRLYVQQTNKGLLCNHFAEANKGANGNCHFNINCTSLPARSPVLVVLMFTEM